jgi:hypothetical protein
MGAALAQEGKDFESGVPLPLQPAKVMEFRPRSPPGLA